MTTDAIVAPTDAPAREALEPHHCGYEWEARAFCGAPFKWRTHERPNDERGICAVCDAIRGAKEACGVY